MNNFRIKKINNRYHPQQKGIIFFSNMYYMVGELCHPEAYGWKVDISFEKLSEAQEYLRKTEGVTYPILIV